MMTYEQRMIAGHDRVREAMVDGAQSAMAHLTRDLRLTTDDCLGVVAGAALSVTVGTWAAQSNLTLDQRNQLMDEVNAVCIKFFSAFPRTTVNLYDHDV